MLIKIKITNHENASHYGVDLHTVIEEEFETYVAAVVASEIGNAPLEACKAQAVASRTFAYRYILKDKPISDSSSSAQAFRIKRYSESYQRCIDAVKMTKNQILTDHGNPIDAYFSSSNGGMTTSSEERWGGARFYLVSQYDPWDAAVKMAKLGHGVGLSQAGAKYAAEIGINYKDILAFYYPGTAFSTIQEKEDILGMISLNAFLSGVEKNAKRIKGYKQPYSGQNGLSDCIGLIIGALELEGQKWGGIHGSNYSQRKRSKNGRFVHSASELKLGDIVYKYYKPSSPKYNLPAKYKHGGAYYDGDLNDYYHVGVVTSVNPLTISHCSSGGMHYDHKLGNWGYAAECSLVRYTDESQVIPVEPPKDESILNKYVVDVPDDTSVNVRARATFHSNILTKLPEGTIVKVTSKIGEWSHVEYSYDKTGTGYVMNKFIREGIVDVPDDTSVNVRSKASTSANKITTLPEGTAVKVLSSTSSWSKIEYSVKKTGSGYVMNKYLKAR